MFNINLFDLMNAKDNALHDNLESDDNEEFNISITISSKKKEKFDTVQKESNKAKEAIPKEEKKDINTKDNGSTSNYLVGEELYNKTFVQRSQKNSSKPEKIENIEDKKEEVQNSLSSHSNVDSDLADMMERMRLFGNDDEISDNMKRYSNDGDDVCDYFGK